MLFLLIYSLMLYTGTFFTGGYAVAFFGLLYDHTYTVFRVIQN